MQKCRGIFILWEGALEKMPEIELDIKNRFNLLLKAQLNWDLQTYQSNISRLYLRPNFHVGFTKYSKKFGKPPFVAYLVEDLSPEYRYYRSTSGDVEYGNHNFINAKSLYREGLNHPYLVHGTGSEDEYKYQSMLLFGNEDNITRLISAKQPVELGNLNGHSGWPDLKEMLKSIGEVSPYCLLRYPSSDELFEKGVDIDILCADYKIIAGIINLCQRRDKPYKGYVLIDKKKVSIDLRFVGDGYFPESWQNIVLSRRVSNLNGSFECCHEDQYFLTLYHCLLHKGYIDPKYYEYLVTLEGRLDLPWSILQMSQSAQEDLLIGFLRSRRLYSSPPVDVDVGLNQVLYKRLPAGSRENNFTIKKRIKKFVRRLWLHL